MGRRKQESPTIHRQRIADAAQILFTRKGIPAVTMDEISREAGYSKATLYVYFKNKEELVSLLVLESMKKLSDAISDALESHSDTRKRYDAICYGLLQYQREFPFYFQLVQEQINIDFTNTAFFPEEKETYLIGEKINESLFCFLQEGINCGELRSDLDLRPTIFILWGTLAGIIQLSANKAAYVQQEMNLSQESFLKQGFSMIYRSIATR